LPQRLRVLTVAALALVLISACAKPNEGGRPGSTESGLSQPQRGLTVIMRDEPVDLTSNLAKRNYFTLAMFNAPLTAIDDLEVPYAVLSSVPALDTDTWRVNPDGTMETTYRLKPNLTWHDGHAFTAQDVVFGHEVRAARIKNGLAPGGSTVESPLEPNAMAEISAPAPDTVVIKWNTLFQSADVLSLKPMPEHILGEALRTIETEPQRLGSHPYWTSGWVGMGPYRLARWEPGAFLEGSAFEGYVFGPPKIARVVVKWSADPNTTVTRVLSGDVDLVMPLAIYFDQVGTLRQEWAQSKGKIILTPTDVRYIGAQMRPDLANPRAVLDLRVRKASLHAIDRQALVDALLEPGALVAETAALPTDPFYDEVLRVAARYPFDTRLTDQLMAEAGFAKGADGIFTSPTEGRYAPELFGISEGKDGRETTAVADYWRKAGIDARLRLAGSVEVQNSNEMKATYPAWRDNYTFLTETLYGPSVATAQNRWGGRNKIGWIHPEFDRLFDLYTGTLQLGERHTIRVQQYRLINEELPGLPLNFELSVTPYAADLRGPLEGLKPTILHLDNLHAWQWVR